MKPLRFIVGLTYLQLFVHFMKGYEVLPYALFVLFSTLVVMWGEWKESI